MKEHYTPFMGITEMDYINVFRSFEDYIKFYCDKNFWERRQNPEKTIHDLPVIYWNELDHTVIDRYKVFRAYLDTMEHLEIDLEIAIMEWQFEIAGKGYLRDIF